MIKLLKSKLSNEVNIPVSKSYLHRALILAALQKDNEKTEIITNENNYQDDVLATIDSLRRLGARIFIEENKIVVFKTDTFKDNLELFVNESGTTLRFLIPLLASLNKKAIIKGAGRVIKRPLGALKETLENAGSVLNIEDDYIKIEGKIIDNKRYQIDTSISSQYISAMLIALTQLNNTKIELVNNISSKNYIELTKKVLEEFGYSVNGEKILEVKKIKKAKSLIIAESDWSCAVSIFGLALSGEYKVNNLCFDSIQPDIEIYNIFKRINSVKKINDNSVKIKFNEFDYIDEDIDQKPDIAPVLSSILCFGKNKSVIRNVKRLKDKESDRLEEIIKMLNQVYVKTSLENNNLIINPISENKVYHLKYEGSDHRMLMAHVALLCGLKEGSTLLVENEKCAEKSYKNYFDDLLKLGFIME